MGTGGGTQVDGSGVGTVPVGLRDYGSAGVRTSSGTETLRSDIRVLYYLQDSPCLSGLSPAPRTERK